MFQVKFFGGGPLLLPGFAVGCFSLLFATATAAAELVSEDEDIQARFQEGMDAIDEDRLKTAREAFQTVLSNNPGLHRARLELARTYYFSYNYSEARDHAQQVLDDPNTPPSVRTTVLAFLAQIDKDEKELSVRNRWSPSIYMGMMYDSNVDFGPNRDIITSDLGPFVLDDDSKELSDTAFVINPGIAHTYNPGKTFELAEHSGFFLWQSQGNAYYRSYIDETDFNLGVLTLSTGPAWVVPRHWRASINLQGDKIWLDEENWALFGSINPTITWQLGDVTELTLDAILTRRYYQKNRENDRNGWYKSAGVALGRYFNNRKVAIQVGADLFRFDTDKNQEPNGRRFSNDGWEAFVGGIVEAWTHGSVYTRVSYRSYDYVGVEPGFSDERNDDERLFIAGFEHDIQSGLLAEWSLLGSYSYTDNKSIVPTYDYDRDQFNLGISRSF